MNDDLLSDLVKQNRRILKLSGKKSKKAFFKAYYVDKEGILRIASVTRDDVKTKSDLEGKLRLLLELVKAYGQDLQVTGFETEEVTETWDADENEELGEP